MRTKFLYLLLALGSSVLAGCTSGNSGFPEDPIIPDDPDYEPLARIERVNVTAEDVGANDGTRTAFELQDSKLAFSWSAGDEIGIFPRTADAESQVKLTLKTGSETKNATFTGGGWALLSNTKYVAYYPYQSNATPADGVSFSYEGQQQTGNGSLAHLGKHDFMATMPTASQDNELNFAFKHLNAIVQFRLTMPIAVGVDRLTLSCSEPVLWTSGKLSFTDDTYEYQKSADNSSNKLSMDLVDIAATEGNREVVLYMNVPPIDFSAKDIIIVLHGTNNRVYQGLVSNGKFVSGKAYRIGATLQDVTMESNIATPGFNQGNI